MYNQKPLSGDLLDYGDPLSRGIVAFWLFNEDNNSNKVFDLSGNGNTGTLVADAHFVPGKFGSALDFDGTLDGVTIPHSPMFTFGNSTNDLPFSLVALLYINSSGDGTNRTIVSKFDSSDEWNAPEWFARVASTNKFQLAITDKSAQVSLLTLADDTAPTDTWVHVVFTYDGSEHPSGMNIYQNGIIVASTDTDDGNYVAMEATLEDVRIGVLNNTIQTFNGLFSHAMIYNRVLYASEIALLYQEPFRMIRTRRRRIITEEIAAAPPTTFPYYYREIASRRIA